MAPAWDKPLNPLLKRILDNKRAEVSSCKALQPLEEMRRKAVEAPLPGPFSSAIRSCPAKHRIIAEVKKISPGAGFVREGFDPVEIAKGYEKAGAAAVSVLTDEKFFGGSPGHLSAVRRSVALPLLRKDFIIDPYQLYEARLYGASAVLIMAVNMESASRAEDLCGLAGELWLEVLFEIHDEDEIRLIPHKNLCVGINNRDFRDEKLKVDTATTRRLAPLVKGYRLLVSESGIADTSAIEELEALGVDAFLVGSALMREKDPASALKKLAGG